MCGICGQLNYSSEEKVSADDIRRMMDTIAHRGPDDSGMHLDGPLGLGFRRLSIIDLSPAGHQPMSNQDGSVWVVFNGEIYNFPELRAELSAQGHVFRSHCDTEVIVHGYKQWGDGVLNRLNGMFDLAIWDTRRRRLVLARDQMGIKPLYYSLQGGTLRFGSEIRTIRAALPGTEVDACSLALFLQYRYTPAPRTLFAGIQKLAAGEMLIAENGRIEVRRYYDFEPTPFGRQPTDAEATEQLLELYKRAVKRQLMSDVPLGLLLSGGIDSGLLLGLMSLYGKEWHTFTVGYGSSFRDDELKDAEETARIYGARHHSVLIDRSTFEAALPRIVNSLEEPIASSSIVPMYFVCERARQDVKVALIGQGPDELFGGYKRHLGVHYGERWRALPGWIRSGGARLGELLPRNETLKRGLRSLDEPDQLRRFKDVFSLEPESTIARLFDPAIFPSHYGSEPASWAQLRTGMARLDELNAFQLLELRSSLPDELLMYGDKLSMAHALEARVPYLDREVVEYVQRLGANLKIRNGARKWLHRQVCQKFLPPQILKRKKRGFAVNVVDDWFRESVGGRISEYLSDHQSLLYRYLRPAEVARLVQQHASGASDHHKILFSLVVLEQWLRNAQDAVPAARVA